MSNRLVGDDCLAGVSPVAGTTAALRQATRPAATTINRRVNLSDTNSSGYFVI
jgi:hypothetical protein